MKVSALIAASQSFDPCAYTPEKGAAFKQQKEAIQEHLLQGSWVLQEDGREVFLQFSPLGSVGMVSREKTGLFAKSRARWELQVQDNQLVLQIKMATNHTSTYHFKEVCPPFILTNQRGRQLLLDSTEPRTSFNPEQFLGYWEHPVSIELLSKIFNCPADALGPSRAILGLDFRPNGTYMLHLYCQQRGLSKTESGTWEVSHDGRFVFLKPGDGDRCLRVKHLQLDEMVVEHAVPFVDSNMEVMAFYYNKF